MEPHITETMTMVTDYILTVQASVYAWMISRQAAPRPSKTVTLWICGLCLAAVGALAGGTAHGFQLFIPGAPLIALWTITIGSLTLTTVLLSWAAVRSARQPEASNTDNRAKGLRWLKLTLVFALSGSAIAVFGPSPHPQFNHFDLAHVVLMAGLYAAYRAVNLRHFETE